MLLPAFQGFVTLGVTWCNIRLDSKEHTHKQTQLPQPMQQY